MSVFILALLTALQIQSYDVGDEYYLLLDTGAATVSFSSFRLNEPERIVLEVSGGSTGSAIPAVGATVGRIERNDLGDKTRFVFHISPGSAYTILHRKNLLLIGFRQELFITDETIETTLAAIDTRMAEKKAALAAAEAEKLAAEQKLVAEAEAKRIAEAKALEEKRLAAAQQPVPAQKVAVAAPEKKGTVAPAVRPAPEDEDALVGVLVAEQSQKQAQDDAARRAALEQKRLEEEARLRAAEQARLAKAEEERKLAEAKRIEDQRRADEQARLAKTAEEKRRAEAEQKRLAEEQKLAEAKAAEAKRLAELKAAEEKRLAEAEQKRLAEEKKLADAKAVEEKRLADLKAAEEQRLAALKKAEEEKKLALAQAETQKSGEPPLSPEDKMKSLKVVKLEPTRQITEDAPPLKVVTLAAKGKLRNLFFRKFPEFSRVTMEVTGELDYAFREVKGGYVIDIHNFEKIPGYLLHIIDTRAFNAEVQYIYPKKDGKIFKIYIKSDQNIAVRKSDEEGLIHFDFYVPSMP